MSIIAVSEKPIGVFDSGMGGLTVLRALKAHLPHESFVYLGDTARLPYGTKSQQTVINYALKMTDILLSYDIKLLVVACNTATTAALPLLQKVHPELPVLGVVDPGVNAAVAATPNHHYALLATETTLNSEVYQQKIYAKDPAACIISQACGLFVALAEENSIADDVARAAVKKYLSPLLMATPKIDSLILGCTHFPVLIETIREFIGPDINIINSAEATAWAVEEILLQAELSHKASTSQQRLSFLVTDLPERFTRVGEVFLGEVIEQVDVVSVKQHGLSK